MTRPYLYQASLIALMSATLALAGCSKEKAAPAAVPTSTPSASIPATPVAPATATVTAVQLGNRIGPDGNVTAEAATFAPSDTITAAVTTQTSVPTASVSGTLGARWKFEDGQLVNEESKTFTFTGPGSTRFQISNPDGWPVGNYSLDILLNGSVVQSARFEVR